MKVMVVTGEGEEDMLHINTYPQTICLLFLIFALKIDLDHAEIGLESCRTVNQQCSSGLQAVADVVAAIKAGFYDIGWGGSGGYAYQKAYLEFFCSQDKLNVLVEKCKVFPSLTFIAANKEGQCASNVGPTDVNAVTWGVFPAKEIIQSTVVDPTSFVVWKDEAFNIWTSVWASLFLEDDPSRKILEQIESNYFLVS